MRIFFMKLLILLVALSSVHSLKKQINKSSDSKTKSDYDDGFNFENGFEDEYEDDGSQDDFKFNIDENESPEFDYDTEESKQSGKDSGDKQCNTDGKAGQMNVLNNLMGDGDFNFGSHLDDDFADFAEIDEGADGVQNDAIDDFWDVEVEDGICKTDVKPVLMDEPQVGDNTMTTCPANDDTLEFLDPEEKDENGCKVVSSNRPGCDKDHMDTCDIDPMFCQTDCNKPTEKDKKKMSVLMATLPRYKQFMEEKYVILSKLSFPTQWSWLGDKAFTFKHGGHEFTDVQTQLDKQIENDIKYSDIKLLGKAIAKVRPTLQYAYYLSFEVNHLMVDKTTGEQSKQVLDKISDGQFNQIKAFSIVKMGNQTTTTTDIHNIRGIFEEFLLKTRLFLYHYFADSYKMFRMYHFIFRRVEDKSRKNVFKTPEKKIRYLDRSIKYLHTRTTPVLDHLSSSLNETITMLNDVLLAEVKLVLDRTNAENVNALKEAGMVSNSGDNFAVALTSLQEKKKLQVTALKAIEASLEARQQENKDSLADKKKAEFDFNVTVTKNYNARRKLYKEYKLETAKINKEINEEVKKLNEKPMPVCQLTQAGIITTSSKSVDVNTPSIFDKCKINDETVQGPRTDIIFIMDGSGSISNRDFQKGKEWVYKVSANVIGKQTKAHVTVSFLQFSSNIKWEITKANELPDLYKKLEGINQMYGGTYMVPALHEASNFQTTAGAQKVIVFLTDGVPSDDIYQACIDLKSSPVDIHAIGIGSGINEYYLEQIGTKSYHVKSWASLMQMGRILVKTLALTVQSSWTVDMDCHNKVIAQLKTDCDLEHKKYNTLIESHKEVLKNLNDVTDKNDAKYKTDVSNEKILLTTAKYHLDNVTATFNANTADLIKEIQASRQIQKANLEVQAEMDNALTEIGVTKLTSDYYEKDMAKTVEILGMIYTALNIVQQALNNIRVSIEIFSQSLDTLRERSIDMQNSIELYTGAPDFMKKNQFDYTFEEIESEVQTLIRDLYTTQTNLVVTGRLAYKCYKTMNNLRYDSVHTDISVLKAAYHAAKDGVDTMRQQIMLEKNSELKEQLDKAHRDKNEVLIQMLCYKVNTMDEKFQEDCEGYENTMADFDFKVTEKTCEAYKAFLATDLSEVYGKEEDFTRKLVEDNIKKCQDLKLLTHD